MEYVKDKDSFKKLILYSEPFTKYKADIIIKLDNYKLYYDKCLNIFYKEYNLFFDLPDDIKEYIIDILHNDLKKKHRNTSYLTRIRNIKQTRKELTYLINSAKGKHSYKKLKFLI